MTRPYIKRNRPAARNTTCFNCGKPYVAYHHLSKFCDKCKTLLANEKKAERQKRYDRMAREEVRRRAAEKRCLDCGRFLWREMGGPFEIYQLKAAKRCPNCSVLHRAKRAATEIIIKRQKAIANNPCVSATSLSRMSTAQLERVMSKWTAEKINFVT